MSRSEGDERSSTQAPADAGVARELEPSAPDLLGVLLGVEPTERASLLALARQWSSLPPALRDAVLRVAGVEVAT